MKNKYGRFSQEQVRAYKKRLHSRIHWLLIYKEQGYSQLDQYFSSIQIQISGLAQLINSPHIITLMTLIESARSENLSSDCNYSKYRKIILDAHSLVDLIPETDGDLDE